MIIVGAEGGGEGWFEDAFLLGIMPGEICFWSDPEGAASPWT
jgi:hypothetical protein